MLLASQPKMDIAIAVNFPSFRLTFPDEFRKGLVLVRTIFSIKKGVISTTGNLKKPTHIPHGIFLCKCADDLIFQPWLHLLPTADRKFLSSSFSIFKRLIVISCVSGFIRGRPFGNGASWRSSTSLRSPHQLCMAYRLIPYRRLNSHTLVPD